ncbi:MAG: response regulator transcription factor [Phycisphaeraceae bacterium]
MTSSTASLQPPAPTLTAPATGCRPPVARVGTIRILLADDHPVVRHSLRSLLELESDFLLLPDAADGREAVELTLRLRPDVLITDVRMPHLTGIEVARELSGRVPGLQIIGLSMGDDWITARAIRHAGAAAFLSKAGDPSILIDTIRRVTRYPSLSANPPGPRNPLCKASASSSSARTSSASAPSSSSPRPTASASTPPARSSAPAPKPSR